MAQAPEEKYESELPKRWFQYQIIHNAEVKDVKAVNNEERLKEEWRFFQILVKKIHLDENVSLLSDLEKVQDLYTANKPDAEIIAALTQLANDVIYKGNVHGSEFSHFHYLQKAGWKQNGQLVPWDTVNTDFQPVRDEVMKMLGGNLVWKKFRLLIIEPLDALVPDTPLEKLPKQVLHSHSIKNTVLENATGSEAEQLRFPAIMHEAACKVYAEYTYTTSWKGKAAKCKADFFKSIESKKSVFKKSASKKSVFKKSASKKSVWKKAHRGDLNMYMFEDYASDEYGSDDVLDLNAHNVDLQPLQNQAVPPFYHPNQYQVQPQPVVIAGYDAGNAMSMDTSMAFATLFGVGLLSFLLCLLFVILVCAATAFGVYASSQRSKPSPYRDEEEHELVSAV